MPGPGLLLFAGLGFGGRCFGGFLFSRRRLLGLSGLFHPTGLGRLLRGRLLGRLLGWSFSGRHDVVRQNYAEDIKQEKKSAPNWKPLLSQASSARSNVQF